MDIEAKTLSPDRTLSALLSPTRSKRNSTVDVASDISVETTGTESNGLLDKLKLDKLKLGRRNSLDERRKSGESGSSRLSRLISRRRHKKEDEQEDEAAAAAVRGRVGQSETDGSSDAGLGHNSSTRVHDSNSMADRNDSIGSSLVTEESDADAPPRPSLDPRPSHAGYLTLSSPLIASETVEPIQQSTTPTLTSAPTPQQTPAKTTVPTIGPPLQPYPDSTEHSISPNTATISSPSSGGQTVAQEQATQSTSPRSKPEPIVTTPPLSGAPTTFVTPPTPVNTNPAAGSPASVSSRKAVGSSRLALSSLPSNSPGSALRRVKASSTGSAGIINPLTPAIEEAKTPGGSLVQPNASGFFTSMFSATQNAVNQLSTQIDKSLGTRSRSGTVSELSGTSEPEGSSVTTAVNPESPNIESTPPREPAIATIGSGNLSFSHLGIPDLDGEASSASSQEPRQRSRGRASSILQDGYMPDKKEEASAAQAVSAAYAEKTVGKDSPPTLPEQPSTGRPLSIGSVVGSAHEDTTPPSVQTGDESGSIFKRSGSVRSRLSGRRRRRESSAATATGGALAAALSATHAALANPGAKTRPPGFALASTKRNQDFHHVFRSVPEDDHLIEEYGAALQREILMQGRLYVSEHHICFAANIFGWVANVVINFDEIVAIEKKNTAFIIPNAIVVQTLQAKNTFASIIGRDPTYDFIIGIWRLSHPNLKATEHGYAVENHSGEQTHDGEDSEELSEEGSGEYYDENEDEDGSYVDADGLDVRSDAGEIARTVSLRSPSGGASMVPPSGTLKPSETALVASTPPNIDFPGPMAHAPTECLDQATHYEKQVVDTTIPVQLGKIYTMMFGPQSGAMMKKFLIDDQKSLDVQYEDDKHGMDKDHKTFSYSYIKPLNASIGPRQTKCIVSQTLDTFDLEKAVSVTCSTLTPDVPSGNIFTTKTRYCLMWGPNNSTRFIMSCTVEWSGKSWLKVPIEKGANDGQEKHGKDLVAFFRAQVAAKSPTKTSKGKPVKGRRKRSETDDTGLAGANVDGVGKAKQNEPNWGLLEPLRGLLGPVATLVNSTTILSTLLVIMTILWLRQSYFTPHHAALGQPIMMTPQRLAAYEELWRKEESGLWNWLEDRVGLDTLGDAPVNDRRRMLSTNNMVAKLDNERLSEREANEAIKVTEEKLAALKEAMERKKGAKVGNGKQTSLMSGR